MKIYILLFFCFFLHFFPTENVYVNKFTEYKYFFLGANAFLTITSLLYQYKISPFSIRDWNGLKFLFEKISILSLFNLSHNVFISFLLIKKQPFFKTIATSLLTNALVFLMLKKTIFKKNEFTKKVLEYQFISINEKIARIPRVVSIESGYDEENKLDSDFAKITIIVDVFTQRHFKTITERNKELAEYEKKYEISKENIEVRSDEIYQIEYVVDFNQSRFFEKNKDNFIKNSKKWVNEIISVAKGIKKFISSCYRLSNINYTLSINPKIVLQKKHKKTIFSMSYDDALNQIKSDTKKLYEQLENGQVAEMDYEQDVAVSSKLHEEAILTKMSFSKIIIDYLKEKNFLEVKKYEFKSDTHYELII